MQIDHPDEQLNRRSFFLRLCRKIWLVPAMVVAGALIGALIYSVVWLSFSGQRQYRQTSKYYLTFGKEENGEVADYYNDYTWNDLIWSVPAISDVIETELPDGMTVEEAKGDVTARILSDVRLLTIEVTAPDPDDVQQLTNALEEALVRYGKTAVQFDNIEFLSSDEVEPVILSDRTRNAVILGAVLGLLVSVVWLWIRELLDDGIYVPEDAMRRYGIPVVVIIPDRIISDSLSSPENSDETEASSNSADRKEAVKKKKRTNHALPDFLKAESKETCDRLKAEADQGASVSLVGEDDGIVQEAEEELENRAGIHVETGTSLKELRKAAHVLAVIPYGKANGTRTEHLLDRMKGERISVEGCILMNADAGFLTKYYGRQKGQSSGRSA